MNAHTQQQINDAEWHNPDRWKTNRFLGLYAGMIYRSSADTRLIVFKRYPRLGWTVNLGHPLGPLVFWGVIWGSVVLVLLVALALA